VNPKKLYKQAQRENIPFHFWFYWVDKRITELSKLQKPQKKHSGFLFRIKKIFGGTTKP
jgi:hypothetical protein